MGHLNRRAKTGLTYAGICFGLLVATQGLWTLSAGDPRGLQVLVTNVIDGDTIRVGRGWRLTTVRLIGVDAPETVPPEKPVEFYGPEAAGFTRKALLGKWVRLEVESTTQFDAYGRLLGYVYLPDGTLFNHELVRQGYARAYTRFRFKRVQEFRGAQGEAREAGRGLWAAQQENASASHPRAQVIGNKRSMIYHVPGQAHYNRISEDNRVIFATEDEARNAGYRRAKN